MSLIKLILLQTIIFNLSDLSMQIDNNNNNLFSRSYMSKCFNRKIDYIYDLNNEIKQEIVNFRDNEILQDLSKINYKNINNISLNMFDIVNSRDYLSNNTLIDYTTNNNHRSNYLIEAIIKKDLSIVYDVYIFKSYGYGLIIPIILILLIIIFLIGILCFIKPCFCCANPSELKIKANIINSQKDIDLYNFSLNDAARISYYCINNVYYNKYLKEIDNNKITLRAFFFKLVLIIAVLIIVFGFIYRKVLFSFEEDITNLECLLLNSFFNFKEGEQRNYFVNSSSYDKIFESDTFNVSNNDIINSMTYNSNEFIDSENYYFNYTIQNNSTSANYLNKSQYIEYIKIANNIDTYYTFYNNYIRAVKWIGIDNSKKAINLISSTTKNINKNYKHIFNQLINMNDAIQSYELKLNSLDLKYGNIKYYSPYLNETDVFSYYPYVIDLLGNYLDFIIVNENNREFFYNTYNSIFKEYIKIGNITDIIKYDLLTNFEGFTYINDIKEIINNIDFYLIENSLLYNTILNKYDKSYILSKSNIINKSETFLKKLHKEYFLFVKGPYQHLNNINKMLNNLSENLKKATESFNNVVSELDNLNNNLITSINNNIINPIFGNNKKYIYDQIILNLDITIIVLLSITIFIPILNFLYVYKEIRNIRYILYFLWITYFVFALVCFGIGTFALGLSNFSYDSVNVLHYIFSKQNLVYDKNIFPNTNNNFYFKLLNSCIRFNGKAYNGVFNLNYNAGFVDSFNSDSILLKNIDNLLYKHNDFYLKYIKENVITQNLININNSSSYENTTIDKLGYSCNKHPMLKSIELSNLYQIVCRSINNFYFLGNYISDKVNISFDLLRLITDNSYSTTFFQKNMDKDEIKEYLFDNFQNELCPDNSLTQHMWVFSKEYCLKGYNYINYNDLNNEDKEKRNIKLYKLSKIRKLCFNLNSNWNEDDYLTIYQDYKSCNLYDFTKNTVSEKKLNVVKKSIYYPIISIALDNQKNTYDKDSTFYIDLALIIFKSLKKSIISNLKLSTNLILETIDINKKFQDDYSKTWNNIKKVMPLIEPLFKIINSSNKNINTNLNKKGYSLNYNDAFSFLNCDFLKDDLNNIMHLLRKSLTTSSSQFGAYLCSISLALSIMLVMQIVVITRYNISYSSNKYFIENVLNENIEKNINMLETVNSIDDDYNNMLIDTKHKNSGYYVSDISDNKNNISLNEEIKANINIRKYTQRKSKTKYFIKRKSGIFFNKIEDKIKNN